MHGALLLCREVYKGWGRAGQLWVVGPAGDFFPCLSFLLKQLRHKLWLFSLGYPADIFSKINEMSPSFQGKQLIVFVAKDKTWISSENWNFRKLVSTPMTWWLPHMATGHTHIFQMTSARCHKITHWWKTHSKHRLGQLHLSLWFQILHSFCCSSKR